MYLVHKHVNEGELTCIFKYKVNVFFHMLFQRISILPSTTQGFLV